jgi:hypothetical protein
MYTKIRKQCHMTRPFAGLNSTAPMQVSTSDPNNQSTAQTLTDGNWHMFTLTTNARGIRGYNIFLDGRLVGSLKPNTTYTSAQQVVYVAHLCAHDCGISTVQQEAKAR